MDPWNSIDWNPLTDISVWISLVAVVLCVRKAQRSGRNPWLWGTLGFLFGPLALLPLYYLSRKTQSPACSTGTLSKGVTMPSTLVQAPSLLNDSRSDGWYYVNTLREPVGPISFAELSTMFETGQLSATNLIWHPNMTEWTPASLASDLEKLSFLQPK